MLTSEDTTIVAMTKNSTTPNRSTRVGPPVPPDPVDPREDGPRSGQRPGRRRGLLRLDGPGGLRCSGGLLGVAPPRRRPWWSTYRQAPGSAATPNRWRGATAARHPVNPGY